MQDNDSLMWPYLRDTMQKKRKKGKKKRETSGVNPNQDLEVDSAEYLAQVRGPGTYS